MYRCGCCLHDFSDFGKVWTIMSSFSVRNQPNQNANSKSGFVIINHYPKIFSCFCLTHLTTSAGSSQATRCDPKWMAASAIMVIIHHGALHAYDTATYNSEYHHNIIWSNYSIIYYKNIILYNMKWLFMITIDYHSGTSNVTPIFSNLPTPNSSRWRDKVGNLFSSDLARRAPPAPPAPSAPSTEEARPMNERITRLIVQGKHCLFLLVWGSWICECLYHMLYNRIFFLLCVCEYTGLKYFWTWKRHSKWSSNMIIYIL